jgi:hypothetical protein
MSILNRIIDLESLFGIAWAEADSPPPQWQAHNAFDRAWSRARRQLRAHLEALIIEMSQGHPPEFDQALEDTLSLPELAGVSRWGCGAFSPGGLWEPYGIRQEDCWLRGDFGSDEQAAFDLDVLRRWYLSNEADPPGGGKGWMTPSSNSAGRLDLSEASHLIAEGLERLEQRVGEAGC